MKIWQVELRPNRLRGLPLDPWGLGSIHGVWGLTPVIGVIGV